MFTVRNDESYFELAAKWLPCCILLLLLLLLLTWLPWWWVGVVARSGADQRRFLLITAAADGPSRWPLVSPSWPLVTNLLLSSCCSRSVHVDESLLTHSFTPFSIRSIFQNWFEFQVTIENTVTFELCQFWHRFY